MTFVFDDVDLRGLSLASVTMQFNECFPRGAGLLPAPASERPAPASQPMEVPKVGAGCLSPINPNGA